MRRMRWSGEHLNMAHDMSIVGSVEAHSLYKLGCVSLVLSYFFLMFYLDMPKK